MLPSNR